MTVLRFKPTSSLVNDYDLFLLDIWGVIIEGDKLYPGVIDGINELMIKSKVFFVSNAPRPASVIVGKLHLWGIETAAEEIVITSGDIARTNIHNYQLSSGKVPIIYHLGEDRNTDILANLDHIPADSINDADILLISAMRDENEDLNEFDELLREAAKINIKAICANPDIMVPRRGIKGYCAGFFAEKYEKFGGKVLYTGKPHSVIYEEVFRRAPGINKNRILMIGDTYETDIEGGNNAGVHSGLVLTGNAAKYHQDYEKIDDKLKSLYDNGARLEAIPTLVTSLNS